MTAGAEKASAPNADKAEAYEAAVAGVLNAGTDLLKNEAAVELSQHRNFSGNRAELLDSIRKDNIGKRIGESDPNADMTATVMVRSRASEKQIDETLERIVNHQIPALSQKEFQDQFGTDPAAMDRVKNFAINNWLTVSQADLESGKVVLKGKVKDFQEAFKVKLEDYKYDSGVARERKGTISVPKEIGTDVQAVLGLDTLRHIKPHFVKQEHPKFGARVANGFLPTEVADAYEFPKESAGAGQSVGIIELGGGLDLAMTALAMYQRMRPMTENLLPISPQLTPGSQLQVVHDSSSMRMANLFGTLSWLSKSIFVSARKFGNV